MSRSRRVRRPALATACAGLILIVGIVLTVYGLWQVTP